MSDDFRATRTPLDELERGNFVFNKNPFEEVPVEEKREVRNSLSSGNALERSLAQLLDEEIISETLAPQGPSTLGTMCELLDRVLEHEGPTQAVFMFQHLLINLPNQLSKELECENPSQLAIDDEIYATEVFKDVVNAVQTFADKNGVPTVPGLFGEAQNNARIYGQMLARQKGHYNFSVGEGATELWFAAAGFPMRLAEIRDVALEYVSQLRTSLESRRNYAIDAVRFHSDTTPQDLDELSITSIAHQLKRVTSVSTQELPDFMKDKLDEVTKWAYATGMVTPLKGADIKSEAIPAYLEKCVPIMAALPPAHFRLGRPRGRLQFKNHDATAVHFAKPYANVCVAHEAVPGHIYQLTRAALLDDDNQAFIRSQAQREGWATYVAECYGIDQGLIPILWDFEGRFITDVDKLRYGARALLALAAMTGDESYLHTEWSKPEGDTPLDRYTNAYASLTGFCPQRARFEVEYLVQSGPYGAMYLLGNQWTKRIAESKGPNQIPAQLERIVSLGNMHPNIMEEVLERENTYSAVASA